MSLTVSICLLDSLSIHFSDDLSPSLSIYVSTSLSLPIYLSIKRCILLSFYPFICLLIILPLHLSIQLSIFLSTFLTFHRSVYISMYLSKCPFYPSLDPCVSHSFYVRTIGQEHRQGGGSRSRKREPTTTYRNIVNDFCPKNHLQFSKTCLKHVLLTCGKEQNPLSLPGQPHPNFKKWSETVKFLTLLTCECTSRLISGPDMCCSWHFDFETCFAPQRRSLVFGPKGPQNIGKNTVSRDFSTFSRACIFLFLTFLLGFSFFLSLPWLFPPLLFQPLFFHLSILSEVWILIFLRRNKHIHQKMINIYI